MEVYPIPGFSDPVSSLTHLVGAAVFACLTPFLLWRGRGHAGRLACLGIFAFSTVFLLSMSGFYHLLPVGSPERTILHRLDHGAIFVLIAGTFTPAHVILFRGPWRWGFLLFIWLAAAAGIAIKMIYFEQIAEWLGLLFYLGMGWVGAFSGMELYRRHGLPFIALLLCGGLAYTVGAGLEFLGWPVLVPGVVGPHELFHGGVLAGVSLHWTFVFRFASGWVPPLLQTADEAEPQPATS